jgi:hypothetical protein
LVQPVAAVANKLDVEKISTRHDLIRQRTIFWPSAKSETSCRYGETHGGKPNEHRSRSDRLLKSWEKGGSVL